MAGKSSQSNNRGSDLFGYFVSGKFKEYHTQQFADSTPGISNNGIEASGGIVSDYSTPPGAVYRAHVFTGSGKFNVTNTSDSTYGTNIEYLVVAGGGSAGVNLGGGGGAGGLRTNVPGVTNNPGDSLTAPAYSVSVGEYTVIVGAGGGRHYIADSPGNNGSDSEFYPTPQSYPSVNRIRSSGGGGGAGGGPDSPAPSRAGGSGGGAPGYGYNPTGGIGNPSDPNHPKRQGFNGGQNGPSYGNNYIGGGGGGAGDIGQHGDRPGGSIGDDPTTGNGGPGVRVDIIPSPPSINSGSGYYWAGGGGAGAYNNTDPTRHAGDGGQGGGGGGGAGPLTPTATIGLAGGSALNSGGAGSSNPGGMAGGEGGANTGSGGGSTGHVTAYSGNGGSGIVIVRYQIGEVQTGTAKATGGRISFYNNKVIHTFESTGQFNIPTTFNESVEYVVIGGGGGGGGGDATEYGGAGGGAGTYRTGSLPIDNSGGGGVINATITVGAGGYGGAGPSVYPPANSLDGFPGGTTTAALPTSIGSPGGGGGGRGRNPGGSSGKAGGSGGGAGSGAGGDVPREGGVASGAPFPGTIGSTPASGWGHNGGTNSSSNQNRGAGGGGAGGVGEGAPSTPGVGHGADGGLAIQLPATFRNPKSSVGGDGPTSPAVTGADTSGKFYVAGGGGGAGYTWAPGSQGFGGVGSPPGGTNPVGGAGNGGFPSGGQNNGDGTDAAENTGSGGGGGSGSNPPNPMNWRGGNGGTGIVMLAYPA